MLEFDLIIKVK